jgi:hypothetical protein
MLNILQVDPTTLIYSPTIDLLSLLTALYFFSFLIHIDLTLFLLENFNDAEARAAAFSHYKKGGRAFVGATIGGDGEPVFVSCCFAACSDANLYKHGKTCPSKHSPALSFKDFLKKGDVVMADKGTLIQAWLEQLGIDVTMIMPPFVINNLISEEDKQLGKAIAIRRYA